MSEATRHYTGDDGREYHHKKRGIPAVAFDWIARSRAEKISPQVAASDVVFEFGVGSGWNLATVQCARKIGSDVSEFLAESVQSRGIEFVTGWDSVNAGSVDVAICHHALEHVLSPPDVLRSLHRILRGNGKLLLFVPFEKERRYREFTRGEPNHHLYSWNAQTLGNLVEELGFKVQEATIGEFGYDRFAATWAARFELGETGFRFLRRAAHMMRPGKEVRIVATKS